VERESRKKGKEESKRGVTKKKQKTESRCNESEK